MSSVLVPTNSTNPPTPEEVLQQLRALRERTPELTFQTQARKSALARQANISPQGIQEALDAIDSSHELQGAVGRSAPELQQEMNVTAGWASVAAELRSMFGSAQATVLTRRNSIGLTALQTLHISRQLVRKEQHAHLKEKISAMERCLTIRKRVKPVLSEAAKPQDAKQ